MKKPRFAPQLLALLLGTVLGIVVLEAGLRWLGQPRRFRSTRVDETYRVPFHQPAVRRLPMSGSGPRFRVLVVGDSFTWGGGVLVEDSYPRRLERRLWAASLPVRIEVDVLSRPGWGTVTEAAVLAGRWDQLDPDLLVVGYVLNDPLPPSGAEHDRLTEPLRRRRPEPGWMRWLYRRSFLFDLVWDRLENTRQRRAYRDHYELLHSSEHPAWKRTRVAMKAMADLARDDGVPAVLVIFPVFDFERPETYAYADVHQIVRRAAHRAGYRVLDLLPTYRGVEGRRLPVVPFTDAHPNELAHRLAAESIARFLRRERLVPTGAPPAAGESETRPPPAP